MRQTRPNFVFTPQSRNKQELCSLRLNKWPSSIETQQALFGMRAMIVARAR